jgi:hypothetical protein
MTPPEHEIAELQTIVIAQYQEIEKLREDNKALKRAAVEQVCYPRPIQRETAELISQQVSRLGGGI